MTGQAGAMTPEEMTGRVGDATALLKALAHDGRLMILCHLTTGERSVGELEALLHQRQATVSQQLARLTAGVGQAPERLRGNPTGAGDAAVAAAAVALCSDWDDERLARTAVQWSSAAVLASRRGFAPASLKAAVMKVLAGASAV